MKIGIITFYNGNINHGGMLQAYALQKTIENLGYDCEQICLDNRVTEKLSFKDKVKLVFKLKFGVFNLIKKKLYDRKIILYKTKTIKSFFGISKPNTTYKKNI